MAFRVDENQVLSGFLYFVSCAKGLIAPRRSSYPVSSIQEIEDMRLSSSRCCLCMLRAVLHIRSYFTSKCKFSITHSWLVTSDERRNKMNHIWCRCLEAARKCFYDHFEHRTPHGHWFPLWRTITSQPPLVYRRKLLDISRESCVETRTHGWCPEAQARRCCLVPMVPEIWTGKYSHRLSGEAGEVR